MKSIIECLEEFPIFVGLKRKDKDFLRSVSNTRVYKKNQVIYLPGVPSNTIYFCNKGRIKFLRMSKSGTETTIRLINPGEMFGELTFFEEKTWSEKAVAIEDTHLCELNNKIFKKILDEHPQLYFDLSEHMNRKIKNYTRKIEELLFKDSMQRLASFLSRFANDYGKSNGSYISVEPFLRQNEIADLIGCSRNTTNDMLNQLRVVNVIGYSRNKLIVYKQEMLSKIAD